MGEGVRVHPTCTCIMSVASLLSHITRICTQPLAQKNPAVPFIDALLSYILMCRHVSIHVYIYIYIYMDSVAVLSLLL